MSRALVLGGGGITGIAWETGVLLGLRDAGLDIANWDLVVGTSAGSVVGSKLLAEPDLDAYFGALTLEATADDDAPIRTLGGRVAASVMAASRRRGLGWTSRLLVAAWAIETVVRERLQRRARRAAVDPAHPRVGRTFAKPDGMLRRIGGFSLAARTASEATYLGVIRETLDPIAEWPDRLTVTGIDALTGELTAFDRSCGAPFFHAVAASCSVPGFMPAITIGGRRYIDGGMASQTHANLATGYDEVFVIAPIDLGRLAGEVAELRASGAQVTVVTPSAKARKAIGRNIALLDPARRARSALAGLEDGRRALRSASLQPSTTAAVRIHPAG